MKGIGIILMVMGHCGFPFTHWIFLFHMALFFMISGFCWNESHSESIQSVVSFGKRRFKDLYIPFVVCNLAFLLLTNVFIDLNLYSDNPLFLESLGDNAGYNRLTEHLGVIQMLRKSVMIVLLLGGTQLGGPTWFFGVLFVVCVCHTIISLLVHKISPNKKTRVIVSVLILVCVVISVKILTANYISNPLQNIFGRIAIGYFVFLLGIGFKLLYQKNAFKMNLIWKLAILILSLAILVVMDNYASVSIATAKITSVWSFTLCSVAGTIFVYTLATLLPDIINSVLEYFGKNTRPIVCLHMISFKIVSFIIIALLGMPYYMLASFPTVECNISYMWIVYSLVGLALPLIVHWGVEKSGYLRKIN